VERSLISSTQACALTGATIAPLIARATTSGKMLDPDGSVVENSGGAHGKFKGSLNMAIGYGGAITAVNNSWWLRII